MASARTAPRGADICARLRDRSRFRRSLRLAERLSPQDHALASRIMRLPPPPGVGIAASLAPARRRSAMARSPATTSPPSSTGSRTSRDAAANAAGFRIAAISLTGQQGGQPAKKCSRVAGVTGHASLLFLDADAARTRLMTNPWIADATVLKLYPDQLQITHHGARRPLRSGRRTAGSASSPPTAPCSSLSSTTAMPHCRSWSAAAPSAGQGFSRRPRPLSRHPRAAARVDPGGGPALEPAAQERHRRAAAGRPRRAGARTAGRARSRQEAPVARHRRHRSAAARPRDRAAVGRGRAGARGGAQGQEAKKKGGEA